MNTRWAVSGVYISPGRKHRPDLKPWESTPKSVARFGRNKSWRLSRKLCSRHVPGTWMLSRRSHCHDGEHPYSSRWPKKGVVPESARSGAVLVVSPAAMAAPDRLVTEARVGYRGSAAGLAGSAFEQGSDRQEDFFFQRPTVMHALHLFRRALRCSSFAIVHVARRESLHGGCPSRVLHRWTRRAAGVHC